MARLTVGNASAITLGSLILCSTPALGQTIIQGGFAHDNVITSGARAPGQMVDSGVARAQGAIRFPRGGVTITETEEPMSFSATVLLDVLPALFEELNQAIVFFENLLRARAGLPPRVPLPDDDRGTTRKSR